MKKRLLAILLAGFMIVQTGTAVLAAEPGIEADFGSEEILTETTDSAETEDEIQMDTSDFQDEDEIQMENEPEEDEVSDVEPEIADYYISKDGNWKYFLRETGNAVIVKYILQDGLMILTAGVI